MQTRRNALASLAAATQIALVGCTSDGERSTTTTASDEASLVLSSPSFAAEATIPERFTCEGENVSPPLRIGGVPDEADALALIVDDPDAPRTRPFVHWLLWNVSAYTEQIPEDVPHGETVEGFGAARQGTNDADVVGYSGPCPPESDDPHTYRFTLYALESRVAVEGGAKRRTLSDAMEGFVVASTRLTGEFDRNSRR